MHNRNTERESHIDEFIQATMFISIELELPLLIPHGDGCIPNWREQDIIDYMRHRHYAQGWSGNKISKQLNELKVKGKKGGSWTSSMVLRTCRYTFHENRKMFEAPDWWGSVEYHDSVSW
jgi:hypothetical protein